MGFFILFGLFGIGALFILLCEDHFRRYTTLEDTPTVLIKDLEDGQQMEVTGELHPLEKPLNSPLFERNCVFFRIDFFKKVTVHDHPERPGSLPFFSQGGRYRWVCFDSIIEGAPCGIKDETGMVEIIPQEAELDIEDKTIRESETVFTDSLMVGFDEIAREVDGKPCFSRIFSTPTHFPQALKNVLTKHNKEFVALSDIKVEETIIDEGARIFASGKAVFREGKIPLLTHGDQTDLFLTNRCEKTVTRENKMAFWIYYVGGLLILGGIFLIYLFRGR